MIKFNHNFISNDDIKFCFNINPTDTIVGSLLYLFIAMWRGQFVAVCKSFDIKESNIQSFDTAKFQSKLLNNQIIRSLFALVAFKNSLLLDAKEYVNSDNKRRFITEKIDRMLSPGEAKILASERIVSENEITINRRGIMARLKGNVQAVPLFQTGQLIKGGLISKLTFEDFMEMFINDMVTILGINDNKLLEICFEVYDKLNLFDTIADIPLSGKAKVHIVMLARCLIKHYLFNCEEIKVIDGIGFNNGNNLLCIENGFSINRPAPKVIDIIHVDNDTTDPILKEIFEQQQRLGEITKTKVKRVKRKK